MSVTEFLHQYHRVPCFTNADLRGAGLNPCDNHVTDQLRLAGYQPGRVSRDRKQHRAWIRKSDT